MGRPRKVKVLSISDLTQMIGIVRAHTELGSGFKAALIIALEELIESRRNQA